jgi:hypothetical protein
MSTGWDELRAAAAPVLADLDRTRPGCVRLELEVEASDYTEAWLWDTEAGSGRTFGLRRGEDFTNAVLEVTGQVQEIALDVLWRAWPECPQHASGHPLDADILNKAVVWRCGVSGKVIAQVGELRA